MSNVLISDNFPEITEEEEEDEEEYDDDDDDIDVSEDLRHDNWEIQMLAAELKRRESRNEERLSSGASDPNESTSGVRRRLRSDTLDTDTENSELEIDRVQRPRAASFDHSSIGPRQRTKGILKAFSFDRDRDQL